ncbi:unnamed protein product [Psylliodes chrysocephalus]|uniref:BED-type domain-containing protein n=1 Tax=Psylliodes chrysocephalus TaxID=3402493 RepID=A0A9P0G2R9_9CUCU|nr:unnamed protein product [Psylliodes chrysocephala]
MILVSTEGKMPPKSNVWKYFDKTNKEYSICNLCNKKIKTCGNTSNLRCHIKSIHNQELFKVQSPPQDVGDQQSRQSDSESAVTADSSSVVSRSSFCSLASTSSTTDNLEIDPDENTNLICSEMSKEGSKRKAKLQSFKRQCTVKETFANFSSYREGGNKYNKITNNILYMICCDYQPMSFVEDTGFQKLMRTTAHEYKIPSRKTIDNLLEKKYEATSTLYRDKIALLNYYSLTTDIWTETRNTKSFLGVTLHFCEDIKLYTATIVIVELEERHTGEYIAEALNNVCQQWRISSERVSAVVTDGAANMCKAIDIAFGKKKHLHCFAHQLNLVAEKSIKSVEELEILISKIKSIVTFFEQSVHASDELRKAQKEENEF